MTDKELNSLIMQIQYCHGINKMNRQPFHFHFCNVKSNSETYKKLSLALGGEDKLNVLPITITSASYTDCYPKEKLVYLTPNSPNVMKEINPDDVYIIGGIVDLAVEDKLTYAKAKKEQIRSMRFPLDNQYIKLVSRVFRNIEKLLITHSILQFEVRLQINGVNGVNFVKIN